MTVLEFEKLLNGYKIRTKESDAKTAFFTTMMTNVHIAKSSQRIKVKDIMRSLHPPTREERQRDDEVFMKEWIEQGGEID